jgi:polyferredoxin
LSSHRWFCLRHHAAAAILVAQLLFLSSWRRRQFCICRCAAAAFLVAPLK